MAFLGKCLLFYLKYSVEMARLYEVDEPKTEGLRNSKDVLQKIKKVGDAAHREVAEFLEMCAPRIDAHFRAICTIERVNNNLEKAWDLRYRVKSKKDGDFLFEIGVCVDWNHANQPVVVPWVWCRGGRRVEDDVVSILRSGLKSGNFPGWWAGSVGLTEIGISIPARFDEPVESDPLVAEVERAFGLLTAKTVKEIGGVARNRGEE